MPRGIACLWEKGQKVPRPKVLAALAAKVAREEKLKGGVNLVFCSDAKVRALNREYRGLDRVTDVLSFPFGESGFAGEVYIANPQAKKQAPNWNNSYFNELRRLIVHGMLHLCGFDHVKRRDRVLMREKEENFLKNR